MRLLFTLVAACSGFDFSGLLGRIQSETMKFDRMTNEYKNQEEAGIRSVQLRERDIDRSLEALKMRLHLEGSPSGLSLLERRRKHFHHRPHKPVVSNIVTFNSDEKELEALEQKRQEAQRNFLAVEEDIAKMPERLFHAKDKQAKEQLTVPLDEFDDEEN